MPKLQQDFVPAGTVLDFAGFSAPEGYLMLDGSSYSRTVHKRLFNVLTQDKGEVTITIASPGVVSLNNHGLNTGDNIELTTDGTLPTGLAANVNYFVIYNDANSFWLADSWANAQAGTKINTSATQSGVHRLRFCPYGIHGANNFKVADARGLFIRGAGEHGSQAKAAGGNYDGGNIGGFEQDKGQGHRHSDNLSGTANSDGNHRHKVKGSYERHFVAGSNRGGYSDNTGSGYLNEYTDYSGTHTHSVSISGAVNDPTGDPTNGTPRTGNENKPASLSMNKIIKY